MRKKRHSNGLTDYKINRVLECDFCCNTQAVWYCGRVRTKAEHLNEIKSAHRKVLETIDQIVRTRRNVPIHSYIFIRLKQAHGALSRVRTELEFTFDWMDQHGYGETTRAKLEAEGVDTGEFIKRLDEAYANGKRKAESRELSASEFKAQLVKAGWTKTEADEEWERIQSDEEAGD